MSTCTRTCHRLALLVVAWAGSGCGALYTRPLPEAPLTNYRDVALFTARPTARVRVPEREERLQAAALQVSGSGIFSQVTYQLGQESEGRPPSDYVLDLSVTEKTEFGWWSAGLLTLGVLPGVEGFDTTVELVVRDAALNRVGKFSRSAGGARVYWVGFFPLTLAAIFQDEPHGEWSFKGDDELCDRQVTALVQCVLDDAWHELGFPVPTTAQR